MLPTELAIWQQKAITVTTGEDPFIFSTQMINELQLRAMARLVVTWANGWQPSLAAGPGGRPQTYLDESILVTIMVMSVWQLSPEALVRRMKRWSDLALGGGFAPGEVISSSQLRRTRRCV